MDQLQMFDPGPPVFPRARISDQRSSHAAAAEIERTGSAKAQAEESLAAVRKYPGSTTRELAHRSGLEIHMLSRRLPELAAPEVGLIRRQDTDADPPPARCAIGNRPATRWFPA